MCDLNIGLSINWSFLMLTWNWNCSGCCIELHFAIKGMLLVLYNWYFDNNYSKASFYAIIVSRKNYFFFI